MLDKRALGSSLGLVALALAGCTGDNGQDGVNGTACTVTQDEDTGTATITCDDGTTAEVTSGIDGTDGENGTSCTVVDNDDGTKTISCDDGTEVIVSDGQDGATGNDGIDGQDGADGTDGTNGQSCTVIDNGDGTRTIECEDGSTVTIADGEDGENGLGVEVGSLHGAAALQSMGEFAEGKAFVAANITGAVAAADGTVTVDFTVDSMDGDPILDIASVSGAVAKLMPPAGGVAYNKWVSYIYRQQTVAAGSWPAPAGTSAWQATSESSSVGVLTNHGDGSYTYAFSHVLPYVYEGGPAVVYERNRTHRVSIMMGGHSGPTATATFDFVPDGSALTEQRNIVETATCQNCHGWEFKGHGGNRLTVENCVICHNPGNYDPNGADGAGFPGETVDMGTMIHKIHAGGELVGIAGADGAVYDDPTTAEDETEDNGEYAIWGNSNNKHEWSTVGFPAIIETCTACHQGDGEQAQNYRERPSRDACGSCHADIDWAVGTNHPGGAAANDNGCALCHPADGNGVGQSVTHAHAWQEHDPRNISEFDVDLTVSAPANGSYFVDGESPVVSVVLHDAVTGALLDHTTIAEDGTAEGCVLVDANDDGVWDPCPARDGLFRSFNLFVSGPRAFRVPVLTTAARAQMFSTLAAPFDIAAAGNLVVTFDSGRAVHETDVSGGDELLAGTATVAFAIGSYTADQVVTTLNANAAFAARGIAWNEGGRVGIRSRNLGPMHAIQLAAGAVNTAIFNDTVIHVPTGSTNSNNCRSMIDPTRNDPKATRTAGSITYALDPVNDLEPGTYIAKVEIMDAGNLSGTNYRTPSVAQVTFQVGQADEEPLIARNCQSCHEDGNGEGYILDYRRHHKHFDDLAVDSCAACHDYMPQYATSAVGAGSNGFTGAKPISRRVHSVHFGSDLNYPLATVDHEETVEGRNWRIGFPQDVRNCETCHPATTSGTWLTNPNRQACSGCHDSDAATAHIRLQTFDPTPADPWSGDELESCGTCH